MNEHLFTELLFFFSLAEVGKLAIPKIQGTYETGQLFLHRIFGYRGVILFPWTAKVYDRNSYMSAKKNPPDIKSDDKLDANASDSEHSDSETMTSSKDIDKAQPKSTAEVPIKDENVATTNDTTKSTTADNINSNKELLVKKHTFYQVLIDSRDCPYVVNFTNEN